jgi:hypothetical protein
VRSRFHLLDKLTGGGIISTRTETAHHRSKQLRHLLLQYVDGVRRGSNVKIRKAPEQTRWHAVALGSEGKPKKLAAPWNGESHPIG